MQSQAGQRSGTRPSTRRERADPERRRVRDMQNLVSDAWLCAHDGDRDTAFRKMRRAEEMATTAAWRVWALGGRASMAAAFGEFGSAREHAALGAELAGGVAWAATTREERAGLLVLAETLAVTDPAAASATLKTYDALTEPVDPDHAFNTDPHLQAMEDYVRGLVLRAAGQGVAGKKLLASAAQRCEADGHLWCAVVARLALATTAPRGGHLEHARAIVAEHFPNSFLARRAGIGASSDPITGTLTPAQRDVLALLLEGLSAREIATRTGRAYNTVRVHIDRLREAFNAASIHALVVDCHRRGIALPALTPQARTGEAIRNCV